MTMPDERPPAGVRPALPVMLRVVEVCRENDEMVTVYLARADEAEAAAMGLELAAFVPGRFFMVWLPGLDEKPYAVSSLDAERVGLTVQQRGPFSTAMGALRPGERVGLRGPFGRGFWGLQDHGDGGRVACFPLRRSPSSSPRSARSSCCRRSPCASSPVTPSARRHSPATSCSPIGSATTSAPSSARRCRRRSCTSGRSLSKSSSTSSGRPCSPCSPVDRGAIASWRSRLPRR